MGNDDTVEETTPTSSIRDQLAKLVLATAVSFMAGKLAETAYEGITAKIRDAKNKPED